MRIWAKLLLENEMVKDIIYEDFSPLSFEAYEKWIEDICEKLDIPNPIILPYHYKCFVEFHNSAFKESDFVHPIEFDQFRIEDCQDSY